MTSGPLVALVLEGDEAVEVVRALNGATDGRKAAPGTIRGDLSLSNRENLVHGSDSPGVGRRARSRSGSPTWLSLRGRRTRIASPGPGDAPDRSHVACAVDCRRLGRRSDGRRPRAHPSHSSHRHRVSLRWGGRALLGFNLSGR